MSFYSGAVRFLRPIVRLFFRVTVIGAENEPDAPYLMCANHSSYIDPVLCACFLKNQIHFIARSSLVRFRFFAWLFRHAKAVPIDRENIDISALRTVIGICRSGECVGIFAQGTRMRRVEPMPEQAMSGSGLIVSQGRVAVLPVSIVTKRRMPGFFRKTYLVIGKPLSYEECVGNGSRTKKEIAQYIFSKVCEPFATPFGDMKNYDKNR